MKINFEPVFEMLNNELSKINQPLELICVGGYVMQMLGHRATVDVDAFFESNTAIDEIICKVGDAFRINRPDELWLNNSVWNKNPKPPTSHCELVYKYPFLTVIKVNVPYLIGMKLESGREQDLMDVATILASDKNENPLALLTKLVDMGFDIDISVLLETYGQAYDMDWLMKFYINNEERLRKLF